ncbi:MAG: NAD(P)-dependent oxidoreductase [Pirellulales bacterium]
MTPRRVLITGAAGNLGDKLRRHLEGRYELRLLDRDARGDSQITAVDLSRPDSSLPALFAGVDAVVHLAADPIAYHDWDELLAPNVDALCNTYEAAAQAGVRRFVYASSNHVMGGYQDVPSVTITEDLPPRPGTRYTADGRPRESSAYAAAKLFGERLGRTYATLRGMEVVAVRIGWVWRGANRAEDLPEERGDWFRQIWLSNRDFVRLTEACLTAELPEPFVIVNGMSRNVGGRWSLDVAQRVFGCEPLDGI